MKCYVASFNVGNIEVWASELYLEKNSVFLEIENSKEEIIERIDGFSDYISSEDIPEILEIAISDLKKYEEYENIDNKLDFFILELQFFENNEQKKIIESKAKTSLRILTRNLKQ